MYTPPQIALMVLGKIRRAWLIAFRKRTVVEKLSRRHGACNRCGLSCKILFKCPAYDDSDGVPKCLIYDDRPGVCGLFPLDEKDLRELQMMAPGSKCGYWFDGAQKEIKAESVRWGPPPKADGKRAVGTFQIIKALFVKPKRR